MATITRRSHIAAVSRVAELAAADDLNGVQDNTKSFDITGAQRVIVVQIDNGTAGTAGIDAVSISHDGGQSWVKPADGLALDSNDTTGTTLTDGILNAAGVEPTAKAAVFKFGPYEGPTAIRVFRYVTDRADTAAWVTGAPQVICFTVGQTAGALTALA